MVTHDVFRVDGTSGMLTDDDMYNFAALVEAADFKDFGQFVTFEVFDPVRPDSVAQKANVVDGIWTRKWEVYGK